MGFWAIIGVVVSALLSIWAALRYLISQNVRLDDNLSKTMIPLIKKSKYKFEINNEITINKKYPSTYTTFAMLNGMPIYFTRSERLLNAGWKSKELISEIYFLRWHKRKISEYLKEISKDKTTVNVMAITPWGSDKLGQISKANCDKIYLDDNQYKDIEKDIQDMLSNGSGKTSALLYGKPGNGKTRLIKYFSLKYDLPIYSVYLNPEYNNLDILVMFNDIPERCIVLFEDFDNYFDKRECIIKNDKISFTFDSILSVLDGVYNEYKQVFFVMTCNDFDKIDVSIKERPSRMKFVKEITGPSYAKRLEIFDGNIELTEMTEGMTMDKVMFAKSLSENYSKNDILDKING
jgi:hypothetical protein